MKELEIDIILGGRKLRLDLGAMDYTSLYSLSMKLRGLLDDDESVLSSIMDADLRYLEEELGKRVINIVYKNGITTVADLLASSHKDLASMEGLGPKKLSDIGNFIRNVNQKTSGKTSPQLKPVMSFLFNFKFSGDFLFSERP